VLADIEFPRVKRRPRRNPKRIEGVAAIRLQNNLRKLPSAFENGDTQTVILNTPSVTVLEHGHLPAFLRHRLGGASDRPEQEKTAYKNNNGIKSPACHRRSLCIKEDLKSQSGSISR